MSTTMKRITLALTKEDIRELDLLADLFSETRSQILKRALTLLHYITINEHKIRGDKP